MPGGRPSSYDPAICAEIADAARSGAGKVEIYVSLGIPRTTFYRWQEEHPEFREAVKEAEAISQAWWEEKGRQGAMGAIPGFNATAFIFQMKNRFPEDWRDKVEHQHSGEMTVTADVSPRMAAMAVMEMLTRARLAADEPAFDGMDNSEQP